VARRQFSLEGAALKVESGSEPILVVRLKDKTSLRLKAENEADRQAWAQALKRAVRGRRASDAMSPTVSEVSAVTSPRSAALPPRARRLKSRRSEPVLNGDQRANGSVGQAASRDRSPRGRRERLRQRRRDRRRVHICGAGRQARRPAGQRGRRIAARQQRAADAVDAAVRRRLAHRAPRRHAQEPVRVATPRARCPTAFPAGTPCLEAPSASACAPSPCCI
jgi:hypothetical protein